jgi:hypothetical protein
MKRKYSVCLRCGRTHLNLFKVKSLEGLLPTDEDILRRLTIARECKTDVTPYRLELTGEQTRRFCSEISLKAPQEPESVAYIQFRDKLIPILKIILQDE